MLGFHGWDLFFILLIVILIFGARRLPELGSALGKSFHALQKGMNHDQPEATEEQEKKVTVEEVEDVPMEESA